MVARTCKVANVPLWVDYDDLYTAFPDWCHLQQDDYGVAAAVDNMRQCVALADVVTVSTEALRCLRRDAVVIPNALNTYIWPCASNLPRQKVVSWRGSGGHNGDVEPVIPALQSFKAGRPDWSLHFFGRIHWRAKPLGTAHAYRDIFSYMESFKNTAPAVHIVPLADNDFNRAKSNIAWLEASAVGAMTIAPGFEEWKRPGVLNYYSTEGFEAALNMAVSVSEGERAKAVAASRAYISEHLTLAKVNQQRIEILKRYA